jgi:hypothetical protein
MGKGKKGGELTRVVVLGGGHYTPMDESENSLAMIRHLIDGTPLDELLIFPIEYVPCARQK